MSKAHSRRPSRLQSISWSRRPIASSRALDPHDDLAEVFKARCTERWLRVLFAGLLRLHARLLDDVGPQHLVLGDALLSLLRRGADNANVLLRKGLFEAWRGEHA